MKRVYLLEEAEYRALIKGRTVEVSNGLAIGLSPEIIGLTPPKDKADRLPKKRGKKRAISNAGKKEMSTAQRQRMNSAIKERGDHFVCLKCPGKSWGTVVAAKMHYMRTHVRGWRSA